MNISVSNWNQKIPQQFLCSKYGDNISPSVKWSPIESAKSYAIVLQDLSPVAKNFIHWYIPSINPSIESISSLNNTKNLNLSNSDILSFYEQNPSIKVKQGINTSTSFGYHGPCAPKNTGNHEYVFYIYALDQDLFDFLNEKKNIYHDEYTNLFLPKIKSDFENLLKKLNINIISQSSHSGFFNPSNLPQSGSSKSVLNNNFDDEDNNNNSSRPPGKLSNKSKSKSSFSPDTDDDSENDSDFYTEFSDEE